MRKLEKLISNLCPDGAEYKTLGCFSIVSRGGNFQKKDFCENGVPCIHYGQIYTRYGLFASHTITSITVEAAAKSKFASKNDIVMAVTSENIEDVCKCVAWLGDDDIAVSGHTAIIHHDQNPRYLSYYFNSAMFHAQKRVLAHGTKVIEVTTSKLGQVEIPIPPLPIQQEIVRILDAFTALEAELEAELEKRKAQYEYYRKYLLNEKGVSKSLREVSIGSRAGGTPLKSNEDYYKNGTISWLRTQEVVFNEIHSTECLITELAVQETSAKWIPANSVIVAISGASAGRCAINKIPLTTNQHCLCIEIDPSIALYKYVFYCICDQYEELVAKKEGPRGDLNSSRILSLNIPIPSLEEQIRIVAILDRFDALVNDITQGLPAEIAARRKQYEYYRDKLLTFKRKESAV